MNKSISHKCRHCGMSTTEAEHGNFGLASEDCRCFLRGLTTSLSTMAIIFGAMLCLLIPVLFGRQYQQRYHWHAKLMPPPAECVPSSSNIPMARFGPDAAWWLDFNDLLANETAEADRNEGYDVLFYGDSITEMWRGSFFGEQMPFLQQAKDIFRTRFNHRYSSNALGVASDEIAQLWWRLLHGQMPKVNQPKAVVLLMGTNDLTINDCTATEKGLIAAVPSIVSRVEKVLAVLREGMPDAHVVLLGLLPRDIYLGTGAFEWPNRMSRAIALANYDFKSLAKEDDHIHYLDCGRAFVTHKGLNKDLLWDGLHPAPKGMEALASCLQPTVDSLVLQAMPKSLITGADSAEATVDSLVLQATPESLPTSADSAEPTIDSLAVQATPKSLTTGADSAEATVDSSVLQAMPNSLATGADSADIKVESAESTANPSGWSVSVVPVEGK